MVCRSGICAASHCRADAVIRYGVQIAQALAAAHDAGIVHRDIKPENIILRPDGYVKLLDFGLAQNLRHDSAAHLAGTLRYMSPEQIQGQACSPASDVFSLGIVLYELLTGQHPFAAGTAFETADAIVEQAPLSPSRHLPSLTKELDRLLRAMLSKEPSHRPAAADVVRLLHPRNRRRLGGRGIAALVVGATLAGVAVSLLAVRLSTAPRGLRLQAVPLSGQLGQEGSPALSPDGTRVACTWRANPDAETQMLLQEVGSDQTTRLPISGDRVKPFRWMPDGKGIAFVRPSGKRESLRILHLDGMRESNVVDLTPGARHDFMFSPDGKWVAYTDEQHDGGLTGIFGYWLATRQRKVITEPPPTSQGDVDLALSPDGSRLAFRRMLTLSDGDIFVVDIDRPRNLERVSNHHARGEALAWTRDGKSIVSSTAVGTHYSLWLYPLGMRTPPVRLTELGMNAWGINSASSRNRVSWVNAMDDTNIWRVPAAGGEPAQVVASAMRENDVTWSRAGLLAFRSERSGASEIWISDAAGNSARRVTNLNGFTGSPRWSPDGRRLAFDSRPQNDATHIYVTDCEPEQMRCHSPVQLTEHSSTDALPNWSADGRYIYFASQRSGDWQVWRVPSTGGGQPVQITTKGGYFAWEAADGKTLYYSRLSTGLIQGVWRKSLEPGSFDPARYRTNVASACICGDSDMGAFRRRDLLRNLDVRCETFRSLGMEPQHWPEAHCPPGGGQTSGTWPLRLA